MATNQCKRRKKLFLDHNSWKIRHKQNTRKQIKQSVYCDISECFKHKYDKYLQSDNEELFDFSLPFK